MRFYNSVRNVYCGWENDHWALPAVTFSVKFVAMVVILWNSDVTLVALTAISTSSRLISSWTSFELYYRIDEQQFISMNKKDPMTKRHSIQTRKIILKLFKSWDFALWTHFCVISEVLTATMLEEGFTDGMTEAWSFGFIIIREKWRIYSFVSSATKWLNVLLNV